MYRANRAGVVVYTVRVRRNVLIGYYIKQRRTGLPTLITTRTINWKSRRKAKGIGKAS